MVAFCLFGAPTLDKGLPIVRNYSPKEYKAAGQNWQIVQDKRGVIYVANAVGLLEFNGVSWRRISIGNAIRVRALGIDEAGRIYYGSPEGFGFLKPDKEGRLLAHSIWDKVHENDKMYTDIYQILATSKGVYFFAPEKIFRYYEDRIQVIKCHPWFPQATTMGDCIFLIDRNMGLCQLDEDQVVPYPGLPWVKDKIRSANLVPYGPHQILLAWDSAGFDVLDLRDCLDKSTGRYDVKRHTGAPALSPLRGDAIRLLQSDRAFLYVIKPLDESNFMATTLRSGVVIFDRKGNLVQIIGKEHGLLDNTVFGVLADRRKNIWACTMAGVSFVEWGSAITSINKMSGLPTQGLSCCEHEGKIYIGTFQNLGYLSFDKKYMRAEFKEVTKSPYEVWDMISFGDELVFAATPGLFSLSKGRIQELGSFLTTYCLLKGRKFSDYLFVGLIDGLALYKKSKLGWTFLGKIEGISDTIRRMAEDDQGNLWITTESKGLLRLQFTQEPYAQFSLNRYGKPNGLPGLEWPVVLYYKGDILVGTEDGIFRAVNPNAAPETCRFERDDRFYGPSNPYPCPVNSMQIGPSGEIWASTTQGIVRYHWDGKNGFTGNEDICVRVSETTEPIYVDPRGVLWVPGEQVYRVDPSVPPVRPTDYQTLIYQVVTNRNKTIFGGNFSSPEVDFKQPRHAIPKLSYQENTLEFQFASAWYESPEDTFYRFKLEGFDKDWSGSGAETRREYTNLKEGRYCFKVQAINIYGTLGQIAEYHFVILPPWYRTIWAYLLWSLVFASVIYLMFRAYAFKLRKQNEMLEKLVAQRTQELRDVTLTDPLTGLRNRRYFSEILVDELRAFVDLKKHLLSDANLRTHRQKNGEVFGVFVLDIDHFKSVNDTYGHEAGDRLLKAFAGLLLESVRKDDCVIRLGGEEFLVVLKRTKRDFLPAYAEKILRVIGTTEFEIGDGQKLVKTCSLGFASFPFFDEEPELVSFDQIIMLADLGLYHAKSHGRNQAVWIKAGTCLPADFSEFQSAMVKLGTGIDKAFLEMDVISSPNPKI